MSSRSYLSIGDVLTLLREEFPDVTISKIRFLESQGLVNPERSPSGYRKFFEHDVERLRWVLRQQREHFLPLKVIRDRLAAGDLSDGEVEPAATAGQGNGVAPEPAHTTAVAHEVPAARAPTQNRTADVGRSGDTVAASASGPTDTRSEKSEKADDEVMARILADASRRAALIPEAGSASANASGSGSGRAPLHVVPDPGASASAAADGETDGARPNAAQAATMSRGQAAEPVRSGGASAGSRAEATASAPQPPDTSSGRAPSSRARGGSSGEGAPGPEPRPGGEGSGRNPSKAGGSGSSPRADRGDRGEPGRAAVTPPVVTGASLTAEELCAASGLSETELAGLQDFGLVDPVLVAGIATFDEDALTVANLAADFRKFGIEARHLRLYRNAVDREIGLIEQVIIPLLRQRNPESRQRALDAAQELGTLGQTMRATLLRSALRQHMGG